MPTAPEEKAYSVEDFAAVLRFLGEEGHEVVLIGRCAVGAYARLQGETVLSADLDLYVDPDTLEEILTSVQRARAKILKRPEPRTVPVAVLDWEGKEVNILTQSIGLPPAAEAIRLARVFELPRQGSLEVLLADPFDLVRNKLELNRPKDRPHVEILLRFVEEEVVGAFEEGEAPTARLAPARRWLKATGSRALSPELSARLLPLARTEADFRFIANTAPQKEQALQILEQLRGRTELLAEVEAIIARRGFDPK